jgi:tetratricopeptide (TPR) repeat protein
MAAYHKDNLDYAIALIESVLQKEPAFFEFRRSLRAAQHKRGGKRGLFKKLLAPASPGLARAQLLLRSDPAEAMHHIEQVLSGDPTSAPAHELLARAAMAADLPKTAVLSLEIVFKNAPGDRAVAMRLAEALLAAGLISRADKIYADLLAANPADLEVARAYKDLGARRSLSDKGYAALAGGTGSYRDALRDESQAASLEQESRQLKSEQVADRLLADYEARLQREPDNLKLLRSIADLHAEQKQFDRALDAYQRLVVAEGRSDPSLEKVIAETTLRRFDHQITQLDPAAPDFAEQRTRLETERDEFQLRECKARSERHPTDLAIRFELGQLYFRAGRITEAIQELQKAQAHPSRRVAALGLLAECFARRGMHDMASRTLQAALREKPVFDDEKKDLVYELGCALQKLGKADDAVEQFKLIYENDITYRDVAARVDAYYSGAAGS